MSFVVIEVVVTSAIFKTFPGVVEKLFMLRIPT
jgi:hypothetical protein